MDEKTTRIIAQVPVEMVEFLDRLAKKKDFKTRSRAIRFCIQQEWVHNAGRQPVKS